MRILKLFGYLFALLLLLIVLLFVFLEVIVEYVIETEGTKVVKAQVDLSSVDIRYSPLGISLNGLQVTNPSKPMTNVIQADLIDVNLAFKPLLKQKVIVETAALSGLEFNTQRSRSGAIPGLTPPPDDGPSMMDQLKQDFKLPSFDLPDPNKLLEQADLSTLKLAKALEASIDTKKKAWDQKLKELPNEATLKEYKNRITKLKETKNPIKRLQALKDVVDIQKDVKKDLDKIKSAKSSFSKDYSQLKSDLAKVKAAPGKDIDKMLSMVGLDADSVQGLAKGLFGDEVARWIGSGYLWYDKLQPYLNGTGAAAKGNAQEEAPKPDTTDYSDGLPKFLVKKLDIDGKLPFPGEEVLFSGLFTDLTDKASVWGKPATLALNSEAKALGKLSFKGILDHVNPNASSDQFDLDLSHFPVKDIVFSDREDFPVTMAKSVAAVKSVAKIQNSQLDLGVDTKFLEVEMMKVTTSDNGALKQAMLDAINEINALEVLVKAKGALENPEVSLSTNLDKVLSQSVSGLVKKEQKKLEGQLKEKLNAKVDEEMKKLNSKIQGFGSIEKLLGGRIKEFGSLL